MNKEQIIAILENYKKEQHKKYKMQDGLSLAILFLETYDENTAFEYEKANDIIKSFFESEE